MADLKAEITPMRMVLTERKPVELMVELVNNSNKTLMISMDIMLDEEIAFDKGGRNTFISKKFDAMQPGERFMQYFDIFAKANVNRGVHPIQITVLEHFNNSWEYVQSKKVKQLTLRVE